LLKLPHEARDIYYHPEYIRLHETSGASANCYVYTEEDNIYLYPFLMRSIPQAKGYSDISTPYGYGGPVYNTEDPAFLAKAYETFYQEASKRAVIAEVIKFHPLLNNHRGLAGIFKGDIKRMCSTVYVDTGLEEDHRWKNIYTHASRKNINKARRNSLEVRLGKDADSWSSFESLYKATMDANKAGDFYFFNPGYFKGMQECLSDNYILATCRLGERPISVMLVLLGTAYAHCHLLGTDRGLMGTGVNNLMHHELIQWCKDNGYKTLHIGGGRTDNEDDQLLRFKKNFSDQVSALFVGESVLNPKIYDGLCMEWAENKSDNKAFNCLLRYRY